jgi:hypothetical protein
VPRKTGIGQTDMLAAVILYVRDQQDLGKVGQKIFLDDMNLELAEPPAEFDVPPARELLITEYDNDIVVEGALDFAKGPVIEVAPEIKDDFRAACRAGLFD